MAASARGPGMDVTARGAQAVPLKSGAMVNGVGVRYRVTKAASASAGTTTGTSASNAGPSDCCARKVAKVFRAFSVTGRHNASRRLQGGVS